MKKYLSLNFRAEWFEAIEAFPEERQLEAYRAIMRYAFYGEVPSDPSIKMAIGLIMHLIDKRRAARKPKEAAEPVPSTETPAQPAECPEVPAANAESTKTPAQNKPVVVKNTPLHTVVRDVRRARRAVCRSNLSDDRMEPHL